jgi:hypothetical protein
MPNSSINMLPLTDRLGAMNVVVNSDIILQPFALSCIRLDLSEVHSAATTQDVSGQAMTNPDYSDRDVGTKTLNDEQDVLYSVKEGPTICSHPTVYVIEQEATLAECGVVLDNSIHHVCEGHDTSGHEGTCGGDDVNAYY